MLKSLSWCVAVVACLTLVGSSIADDPKPKERSKSLASVGMKIKLNLSKDILSGLATADFQKIEKGAKAMKGLNLVEHLARSKEARYQTQLRIFQFATDELVRCGEEKNLEGATLAYTTMTTSCVACHKQLRQQDAGK